MSEVVIRVEDVSKQYRLGTVGTGTIGQDINRWWAKMRGKEDPTLKIGETNDRTKKGESEYSWALKDINFEIKKGEVLGVIGRNGAGKSTLLKVLSRVTAPTTGQVKVKGRIASLLEVGTGFHHELTGRENIYLNGAIMGMTKAEVSSKLDEIVDFSGCERYLDTPVKRYSSGMTVRLGFAVAAHLEPEILIVDEVLAVGDAEFQRKCIGKMKDVAGHGRTVLFVSHNLASVRELCSSGLYLKNGAMSSTGKIDDVIKHYVEEGNNQELSTEYVCTEIDRDLYIERGCVNFGDKNYSHTGDTIKFEFDYKSKISGVGDMAIGLYDKRDVKVSQLDTRLHDGMSFEIKPSGKIICTVDKLALTEGEYTANVVFYLNKRDCFWVKPMFRFEIDKGTVFDNGYQTFQKDIVFLHNHSWTIK